MNELTINEKHEAELSLMDEIDGFCSENGITYYLAYGTLLGSIRHGGFIPWDDDADLWMPREDFERFIKDYPLKNGNDQSDRFYLIEPFEEGYVFTWAKLVDKRTSYRNDNFYLPDKYGLSIDIFPLDEDHGELAFKRAQLVAKLWTWRETRYKKNAPRRNMRIKSLLHPLSRLLPNVLCSKQGFERAGKVGLLSNSNYYINLSSTLPYEKALRRKECFGQGKRISFESNHSYVIPDHPEDLLAFIYGERWRVPVVIQHESTSFWRESGNRSNG